MQCGIENNGGVSEANCNAAHTDGTTSSAGPLTFSQLFLDSDNFYTCVGASMVDNGGTPAVQHNFVGTINYAHIEDAAPTLAAVTGAVSSNKVLFKQGSDM